MVIYIFRTEDLGVCMLGRYKDNFEFRAVVALKTAAGVNAFASMKSPPSLSVAAASPAAADPSTTGKRTASKTAEGESAKKSRKTTSKIAEDGFNDRSFPRTPAGNQQIYLYMDVLRRTLESNHGVTLVNADGTVNLDEIPGGKKVQWGQLVRRVPSYFRNTKFHDLKDFSPRVFKEFERVCPLMGRSPKVFYRFLKDVLKGSTSVLPMPDHGLAPSAPGTHIGS